MASTPAASEENFRELQQDADLYEASLDLIAYYLDAAFEDPAAEEIDRWTVSCLPATNGRARLFTLNVGPMEVLHLERPTEWEDGSVTWRASMYVSRSALEEETGRSLDELAAALPSLQFLPSKLASADGDAVVVVTDLFDEASLDEFDKLPESVRPISELAESLSAKGKGSYEQFHNTWLARAVLERYASAEDAG